MKTPAGFMGVKFHWNQCAPDDDHRQLSVLLLANAPSTQLLYVPEDGRQWLATGRVLE